MTTNLPTTTTQASNADIYRASTDAAGLCREIVLKTAMEIQNRKYVRVEGWQAIAIAHGCTGSARDVERIEGGVRAIGEVRRMSDGAVIAEAEGFVGEDEPTWFGGEVVTKWGKKQLPKRPDYAIRAMAQTRAVSRACRSAFAHVVVLIDANLSTTPAEEVPSGGFDNHATEATFEDKPPEAKPRPTKAAPEPRAETKASPTGGAKTLADRAALVEAHIKACATVAALDAVLAKAAQLMAQLDTADPERLAELDLLAEFQRQKIEEAPPKTSGATKRADDLDGDDVPVFQ